LSGSWIASATRGLRAALPGAGELRVGTTPHPAGRSFAAAQDDKTAGIPALTLATYSARTLAEGVAGTHVPKPGELSFAEAACLPTAWLTAYRMLRTRGRLPDDGRTLQTFRGIGRYTAGAILSFAYGRDAAVLDTNVRRVLGRVFLGPRRLGRARGPRVFWDLAEALVPAGRAYDFNQALMDFGATWCTPRTPRCGACPMRGFCRSAGGVPR